MMVDHEQEQGQDVSGLRKSLTESEIIAQAVLFFSAGYETTQTCLSYVAYLLALNPDCQKRLIKEIDEALEKHVFFKKKIIIKNKRISYLFKFID